MKYIEDIAYLVLLVWLIPLFIVLGGVAVCVILIRRTYWLIRGNSTPLTMTLAGTVATVTPS